MTNITCRECGKRTRALRPSKQYCSLVCRRRAYRRSGGRYAPRPKRRCARCKKWYQPKQRRSKYCCRACLLAAWREKQRRVHKRRRCRECGRWFRPKCSHAVSCSRRCNNLSSNRNRRREIKRLCVEYRGGKCQQCGYARSMAALDFHHRNPRHRVFSLCSSRVIHTWSRLKRELDKCDLLCSNCHRELHEKLDNN